MKEWAEDGVLVAVGDLDAGWMKGRRKTSKIRPCKVKGPQGIKYATLTPDAYRISLTNKPLNPSRWRRWLILAFAPQGHCNSKIRARLCPMCAGFGGYSS